MLKVEDLRAVRIICTHDNCPDGLASALILKNVLPNAEIRFLQHGTPALRDLVAEPGMLFCDITPPPARVAEFVAAGAIVLDHHIHQKSVVEAFGERGVFADEKAEPGVSGAVLAFREVWCRFASECPTVEDFAVLAGIRDTWQKQSPRWLAACGLAEALLFWPRAKWLTAEDWWALAEIGPVLLQKRAEAVKQALDGALRFTSKAGTTVCMFQGLDCTSDAADLADVDLVVGFLYLVDATRTCRLNFSLRSRNGFDCGAFAKSNGGGGHTAAAGFQSAVLDEDPYQALVRHLATYEGRGSR